MYLNVFLIARVLKTKNKRQVKLIFNHIFNPVYPKIPCQHIIDTKLLMSY